MWPVQNLLKPAYDLVSNHICCGVHKTMIIQLPVTTAVLEKNDDLCPSGKAEDNKIIIEFDTRKRDYHKIFKLKR